LAAAAASAVAAHGGSDSDSNSTAAATRQLAAQPARLPAMAAALGVVGCRH
jgi:hypothetical protein